MCPSSDLNLFKEQQVEHLVKPFCIITERLRELSKHLRKKGCGCL